MPRWGRPPGRASGVGRYLEGTEDDVHRFQELESDDEKNYVPLDQAFQHVSNDKIFNPDEVYFNDMDISAWERRASALDGMAYGPGHSNHDEDEYYYDEKGEVVTVAEHEEMLFRRVLDKIRIARAGGNADVQLSPAEIEAYQSKLYGARAPAAHPQAQSRHNSASIVNDAASIVSVNTASRPINSSRSKKSQQRNPIFGSKPKKEKSSHRKRLSTTSSASSQAPPGFVVPGPDGQPMFAPINAYQGSQARDPRTPPRPVSRSASIDDHQAPAPPRVTPPRGVLGAFPGSEHAYRPATPPRQGHLASSRQLAHEHNLPPVPGARSSSIQSARLVPYPVEPYQYHDFSPSSSSPTSPKPQYTRRVSSGPSESSYTAMPRRVPIPAPVPVPVPRAVPAISAHETPSDPTLATQASGPGGPLKGEQFQGAYKASESGKDGERRRKSGRSKKRE